MRLRFGPWPRTRTTRPSFKFSCSNGSTAPRTWPNSTCSRSNQRSLRIWRLCAGGAGSGARGVSGSTCTRPSRSRRSSSRNGSIARGAADTCSARERRRPALGCRHIRQGGAPSGAHSGCGGTPGPVDRALDACWFRPWRDEHRQHCAFRGDDRFWTLRLHRFVRSCDRLQRDR